MRIFCYFVEPAAYTLDLVANVYDRKNINYAFIKSVSLAEAPPTSSKVFLDKVSWISRIRFVIKTFRNNDFIIVNGYNNYPLILTFILNVFSFNKKYIATESDTQLSIPKNPLKRLLKWSYLSIIFRNKYVLGFAGGSKSHKELFRYYGMLEDRISLMPMMVDNIKFYCDNKVFPKSFAFLYVGRLIKHKNAEALIKQFNAHFSDKNAILRIVGTGAESDYLKTKYKSNKINFAGKLFDKDLINEFHNASCFVCPSLFEPWGLVVNEALSSGLPVIATKEVGACYDLIEGKETGLIAENNTEIGEKMLQLFEDKNLLRKYSINASALMKEYWNYDLYESCLNDAIKKVEQWR
ncbi:MAG: glycosyltransferase family 4 protein [Flavobacteriales bacterium]